MKKYGTSGMMPPRIYATPSVTAEMYGRLSGGAAMAKWWVRRKDLRAGGELVRWSMMVVVHSAERWYCWKWARMICDVSVGEYLIRASHVRDVAW
jgi:hypothetical protein